jgi:hypothetical protein
MLQLRAAAMIAKNESIWKLQVAKGREAELQDVLGVVSLIGKNATIGQIYFEKYQQLMARPSDSSLRSLSSSSSKPKSFANPSSLSSLPD